MIERDYYVLEMGKELHCRSYDDLIHFGVKGDLTINVLTGKFGLRDSDGNVLFPKPIYMALARDCLIEYEASGLNPETVVFLKTELIFLDAVDNDFRPTGEKVPHIRQYFLTHNPKIIFPDSFDGEIHGFKEYYDLKDKPVKFKDCVMVVLRDDIERFMNSNSNPRKSTEGGVYKIKDDSYMAFVEAGQPGLEGKTKEHIFKALVKFNPDIWKHGSNEEWWYHSDKHPKGVGGRPKKQTPSIHF